MNPQVIRVWQYHYPSWVRITLSDGEELHWCHGYRHEEGWAREYESWLYEAEEGIVTHSQHREGTDCDGRYAHGGACVVSVASLLQRCGKESPPRHERHLWQPEEQYQRDYAAEAMGY
jgi:hypothetical protein